jgi:hypothetical protein
MGDAHDRGTSDRPQWYCRYIDVDGKRKHRPTHQPTKALAMRYVAEVEARVARGRVGIPERTAPERQGKAMTLMTLAERFIREANPPTKDPERYRAWLRYTLGRHVLPHPARLAAALPAGTSGLPHPQAPTSRGLAESTVQLLCSDPVGRRPLRDPRAA